MPAATVLRHNTRFQNNRYRKHAKPPEITAKLTGPVAAPVAGPVAAPVAAPVAGPEVVPEAGPVAAPVAGPEVVPEAGPEVVPEVGPEVGQVAASNSPGGSPSPTAMIMLTDT
jgi:hypothetical protein